MFSNHVNVKLNYNNYIKVPLPEGSYFHRIFSIHLVTLESSLSISRTVVRPLGDILRCAHITHFRRTRMPMQLPDKHYVGASWEPQRQVNAICHSSGVHGRGRYGRNDCAVSPALRIYFSNYVPFLLSRYAICRTKSLISLTIKRSGALSSLVSE